MLPPTYRKYPFVGAPGGNDRDNQDIDPLTDAVLGVLGPDSPILEGIPGTIDMDEGYGVCTLKGSLTKHYVSGWKLQLQHSSGQ